MMTTEVIIQQLRGLITRIRLIVFFQTAADCMLFYSFFRLLMSGATVQIFTTDFDRNTAMLLIFMLAMIDLCFSGIRRNYKRSGFNLINQLSGDLDQDEAAVVTKFGRMK